MHLSAGQCRASWALRRWPAEAGVPTWNGLSSGRISPQWPSRGPLRGLGSQPPHLGVLTGVGEVTTLPLQMTLQGQQENTAREPDS